MSKEPWKISREMFLSESEAEALLHDLRRREDAARKTDAWTSTLVDRVIIETLMFSGLRNSEFCQLKLGDTPAARKESVLVVDETPRENRTVYIPDALTDLLRRYARDARPQCLPDGAAPRDQRLPLVFNERGKPYERTGLYRRVIRILTAAGLAARASVQLLRHTYGYLAYKRTSGNLLFVQQQLGHAHPMVTAVYAEFVDFPGAELANQIAGGRPKSKVHSSVSERKSR